MFTTTHADEFTVFLKVQNEAIAAIKSGDQETIYLSLLELEMMGKRTAWPRLRQAVTDFLRLHAERLPTREVRDAHTLEVARLEIEDGVREHDARSTRANLDEVENIYWRTRDPKVRDDAAALLRKYAAHAEFYSFTA